MDLAAFIQQSLDEKCLSHFCDDGFTLLMPNTAPEQALEKAKTLCSDLAEHRIESVQALQCSASIGVVEVDGTIEDASSLINHAFRGCANIRQQANNKGIGNDAVIYQPPKERKALGDAKNDEELDAVLEEALEDGQFWLMFQPLIGIRGASGDHYEVKTRMNDSDGNEVTAMDFLQSLNFSQTNTRLDRWIILEATKLLTTQREKGNDTRMLINLTYHSLYDDGLLPWLGVALKAGSITPESIVLQFQEQDIFNHLSAAETFSETLKEIGCLLSIASFGSSDNPLKLLNNVSANYVRITESYTEELASGGDNQAIKAMISSVSNEQCKTVITGVDNASLMAQLWQLGVDFIQGNYLAPASTEMDYEFTDIA